MALEGGHDFEVDRLAWRLLKVRKWLSGSRVNGNHNSFYSAAISGGWHGGGI
jgi:hypothetical protein